MVHKFVLNLSWNNTFKDFINEFANQLKKNPISSVSDNLSLVVWLWEIHVGICQKFKNARFVIYFFIFHYFLIQFRLNLLQNSSTDDIYYLHNLYPSTNASSAQGSTVDVIQLSMIGLDGHPGPSVFQTRDLRPIRGSLQQRMYCVLLKKDFIPFQWFSMNMKLGCLMKAKR